MYNALAKYAEENNLIVKDKNTFICPSTEHDLAYLGNYIYKYLTRLDWFPENVKEWTWFSDKEEKLNTNLVKICKKYKVGLYA
ncbi:hypothetical protein CBLAS_1209 [Campylobacter blaseri]|uniref:Uncharacterized protein n=1 Tax=Campylobacter blaseri TaxID=2042961 RepID=A0A2P8QZW5_9BACT|nr:hypothetical protein [Campylobacter blaseri]PSM51780.1 hypothetical protein CQ405_06535 [Campylobacter blaseri]PSM53571.1 hypothetical protein CRN67_06540 [Campylobacter blaseri]QKF86381.1 hypothetical protein CBLAS_1209 [Campylobacter blaseri]